MFALKMEKYFFILFSLSITSCFTGGVVSAHDNDRLAKVEALLETVINKNQELEKRVEHLEIKLEEQKIVNGELLTRIFKLETKQHVHEKTSGVLETDASNGTQDRNNGVHDRSANQAFLWKEKQTTTPKQKHERGNKRLLASLQTSPPPSTMSTRPATVAFTATLTSNLANLGAGQTIKFSRVVTNVGGAYHVSHGNFVAPSDGVYIFSLTAMALKGHNEHLQIVKDGSAVGGVFAGANSDDQFQSTTTIVTIELAKGNEIWVQTVNESWHGSGSLHGSYDTSFSGWRLS